IGMLAPGGSGREYAVGLALQHRAGGSTSIGGSPATSTSRISSRSPWDTLVSLSSSLCETAMTRQSGGIERSSWLTFRRRLLLVRLLLRGPASSADLIASVQAELGDEGYPPAANAALKHDLDA